MVNGLPYKGTANYAGGYKDSIGIKVGAYAVLHDGFNIEDELLVESGENLISIQIGFVEVSVNDVSVILSFILFTSKLSKSI